MEFESHTALLIRVIRGFPCLIASSSNLAPTLSAQDVSSEDVVIYRTDKSAAQQTRRGKIVEYSGQQLVIEIGNDRQVTIPSGQVLKFETTWSAAHQRANELFEQRDFAAAEAEYSAALREKQPEWVLRRAISQRVLCRHAQQNYPGAAKDFFSLVAADPQSQYFSVIPLNWQTRPPPPALQNNAISWLKDTDPIKQLLGASWLLSTARSDARKVLKNLEQHQDSRIALLAASQLWRTETATADAALIEKWKSILQRIPLDLRAGPYWICGQTMIEKGSLREGQLMLLKVAFLHQQHDRLASASLWKAAASLSKSSTAGPSESEANLLLRQLIAKYPKTEYAASAKALLQ